MIKARIHGFVLALSVYIVLATCIPDNEVREVKRPDTVEHFSVVANIKDGSIVLNWDEQERAAGYFIFWDNKPGVGTNSKKIWNVTPPYTHKPVENGKDYYYRVMAYDRTGEGILSDQMSARLMGTTDEITFVLDDKQVALTWKPIEHAETYNIYYFDVGGNNNSNSANSNSANSNSANSNSANSNNNQFNLVTTAEDEEGETAPVSVTAEIIMAKGRVIKDVVETKSLITDLINHTYYVVVITGNNKNGEGFPSAMVKLLAIETPAKLAAIGKKNQVLVSWEMPVSAESIGITYNMIIAPSEEELLLAKDIRNLKMKPVHHTLIKKSDPFGVKDNPSANTQTLYYLHADGVVQKNYYYQLRAKSDLGESLTTSGFVYAQPVNFSVETATTIESPWEGMNSRAVVSKSGSVYVSQFNVNVNALEILIRQGRDDWKSTNLTAQGNLIATECCQAMDLDQKAQPHLVFFDEVTGDKVQYVQYDNSSKGWIKQTLASNLQATQSFPAISLDNRVSDSPKAHIVFFENKDGSTNRITYTTNNTGAFAADKILSTTFDGRFLDMVMDFSVDQPGIHVVFYDEMQQALLYTTKVDGAWPTSPTKIDPTKNDVGQYVRMKADSKGQLHVTYYDITEGSIKYGMLVAGVWTVETLATNTQPYSVIGIHADDSVHVAYFGTKADGFTGLMYASKEENWMITLLDEDTIQEYGIGDSTFSMDIDAQKIYISYPFAKKLKHVEIDYTRIE